MNRCRLAEELRKRMKDRGAPALLVDALSDDDVFAGYRVLTPEDPQAIVRDVSLEWAIQQSADIEHFFVLTNLLT
jgi:hypothetical protein